MLLENSPNPYWIIYTPEQPLLTREGNWHKEIPLQPAPLESNKPVYRLRLSALIATRCNSMFSSGW